MSRSVSRWYEGHRQIRQAGRSLHRGGAERGPGRRMARCASGRQPGRRRAGGRPDTGVLGSRRDAAIQRAHEQFRWFAGGWKVNADLPTPAGFAGATQFVRLEDVAGSIPCGPDLDAIVDAVRPYWEAGFTDVALVQVGGETQDLFLKEGPSLCSRPCAARQTDPGLGARRPGIRVPLCALSHCGPAWRTHAPLAAPTNGRRCETAVPQQVYSDFRLGKARGFDDD